ncbi:MAG: hypothetical protein ACK6BG_07155 [Cyanobacteriota bacterium]
MPSPAPEAGSETVQAEVASLLEGLAAVAADHEGDPLALLLLLRQLEKLHRTIQDGAFRASLPSERSALFRLLQDMERSGGWPYIPRLQLRTFLDLLQSEAPVPQNDHLPPGDRGPMELGTSEALSRHDQEGPDEHVAAAA